MYCMYVHTDFNVGNIDNRESQKPENFVGSFDIPFTGDTSSTADFSGINGYFTFRYQFRTSLLPTYAKIQYRDVKYPLIPEKPGIRRGIPREGAIIGDRMKNSVYLPREKKNSSLAF